MLYAKKDVIDFVEQNDVKFIRLAFCDIFGRQKNISIMPGELERAFDHGISFDASAIAGFGGETRSDLFLVPDPATLAILPWRPSHGKVIRLFCDICRPDGSPFELCGRTILKNVLRRSKEAGVSCYIGSECEFYLFCRDENGNPTDKPLDQGGYMDVSPDDKGENIRREICLTLESMGFATESSHHEEGPGQNEIDFKYSEPLKAADNVVTFKSVVRTLSASSGLYASFDPKPIADKAGNGFHINVSPHIVDERDVSAPFMAGILARAREMTAVLNPSFESYKRLGCSKAPKFITWSPQNRSQLIRIPAETGALSRIELRSADPLANPYHAFALILAAGLQGIEYDMKPADPVDANMYQIEQSTAANGYERLPGSFPEAAELAGRSAFVRSVLPAGAIDAYLKSADTRR